jgi:hypothetical protein
MTQDVVYVALLYDLITSTPAGVIRAAEFFRVTNGKIREIRAVFDPTNLRKVMSAMSAGSLEGGAQ